MEHPPPRGPPLPQGTMCPDRKSDGNSYTVRQADPCGKRSPTQRICSPPGQHVMRRRAAFSEARSRLRGHRLDYVTFKSRKSRATGEGGMVRAQSFTRTSPSLKSRILVSALALTTGVRCSFKPPCSLATAKPNAPLFTRAFLKTVAMKQVNSNAYLRRRPRYP